MELKLIIPALILIGAYFYYLAKRLVREIHILQLNSYMNDRWRQWFLKTGQVKIRLGDLLTLVPVAVIFASPRPMAYAASLWGGAAIYLILAFSWKKPPEKKAFVMTPRAKRLFTVSLLVGAVLGLGALLIIYYAHLPFVAVGLVLPAIGVLFPWLIAVFANFWMAPIEKNINLGFYLDAQRIISQMGGLTVVGITGSYGKTSSKMILGELLGREFTTYVTPGSFNTPMGLTRVIRENLRPTHEIFLAEMGAKQVGDIQELCDLVKPKIGILTAIGEQHLETFGSLEKIIQTKFELIQALPEDGTAILNFDNPYIRENAAKAKCRMISFGVEQEADYRAKDIISGPKGASFTVTGPQGEEFPLETSLLGRHNINNILGAVACARVFGLTMPQIAKEVKRLRPVEHRLQLLNNPGGYNVIDDAFNSNPAGAKMALEVLDSFQSGQKIMVTPGMVELGEQEYQLNKAFALDATQVCDYMILVGKKHSQPLQDGLKEGGYPRGQYYVAADLDDARAQLAKIAKPGDTVLFENDLPDTYTEN